MANQVTYSEPDEPKLSRSSVVTLSALQDLANSITDEENYASGQSDEMYAVAADQMRMAKGLLKRWDAERLELVQPLMDVARKINAKFAEPVDVVSRGITILNQAMVAHLEHKDRDRKAAEALARQRAEEERRALEAKAAAERRAAEAKAEQLRREAEAAVQAGRAAEAAKLAAKADVAIERAEVKAGSLEAQAIAVPTAAVMPAMPKVTGTHSATTWKHEVHDLLALCKAVSEGKASQKAIKADDVFLGQQARSLKDDLESVFPGVRAIPSTSIVSRSR